MSQISQASLISSSLSVMSAQFTLRMRPLRFHQDPLWMELRRLQSYHKSIDTSHRSSCTTRARYSLPELVTIKLHAQGQFKSGNFHLKRQASSKPTQSQLQESERPQTTLISSQSVRMACSVSSTSRTEIQRVKRVLNSSSNTQRKS